MKLPRLKQLQKVQEFVNESKQTLPEFVVCINNVNYPASLELHKIYRVLIDEDPTSEGDIRIIDESGEDYLYPSSYFVPIQVPQTVEKPITASLKFTV